MRRHIPIRMLCTPFRKKRGIMYVTHPQNKHYNYSRLTVNNYVYILRLIVLCFVTEIYVNYTLPDIHGTLCIPKTKKLKTPTPQCKPTGIGIDTTRYRHNMHMVCYMCCTCKHKTCRCITLRITAMDGFMDVLYAS